WLQFGAVMPLARGHYNSHESGGQAQEPWSFGPVIEAHARAALELRYRLLPYLYSLFREAATTGAPVLRPLAWHFPRDPRGRTADLEVLCGPALLVAPVTRPGQGAEAVYLPAGRWMHLATGDLYEGGQDVLVPTPLDHFPLFQRAGSVIPLSEPARNAEATAQTDITLLAAVPLPGTDPLPAFPWYEDNGSDLAYQAGDYRLTPLRCTTNGMGAIVVEIGPVTGRWTPPARVLEVALAGLDRAPRTVTLTGSGAVPATWDTGSRRLIVSLPEPGTGDALQLVVEP
ncbi:MAG TPA: TIM-barrel domain-containing protein, partial [Chloroflexia bacterium]|nr:TIM-barrel domain-containing protein [Chloroflexia bacterium]